MAGQLAGIEGYLGNAGSGLLAGMNAARLARGESPVTLPRETMLGALVWYITHAAPDEFQPMKANFGLLPPLDAPVRGKRPRYQAMAARALRTMEGFRDSLHEPGLREPSI